MNSGRPLRQPAFKLLMQVPIDGRQSGIGIETPATGCQENDAAADPIGRDHYEGMDGMVGGANVAHGSADRAGLEYSSWANR